MHPRHATLPLLALLASACGEDALPRAYACTEPARIVILKRDEMRSACFDGEGKQCDLVGIAVPEGVSTRLGLAVYDEDKNECDPAETVATIEGEAFDLVNDGTDVWLTPLIDVFDVEKLVEPAATLTVAHGSLRASWQVMAMVDLAGTWEITVDGLTVGDFDAAQSGRFIRWADCTSADTRPECSSGLLFRTQVQLFSPIGALKLDGAIRPTRDRIDGTWTNGGNSGAWYAKKILP